MEAATTQIPDLRAAQSRVDLGGVPDGMEGLVVDQLVKSASGQQLVFVASNAERADLVTRSLSFFAPDVTVLQFPAWDCMPYDRVSPNADISARRMSALYRLASDTLTKPAVIVTTAGAAIQRVPGKDTVLARAWSASSGSVAELDMVVQWLSANGFDRTPTVREVGEYAVRGGIVDLYPPGFSQPVRLDFFGDTLESIRPFDPLSQRTVGQMNSIELVPASEVILTEETIGNFRTQYREAFGAVTGEDGLYQSISEGRRFPGMEHWLPLFHDTVPRFLDYLAETPVVLDPLADEAVAERIEQIDDHYQARLEQTEQIANGATPYKPISPEGLYLDRAEWDQVFEGSTVIRVSPFVSSNEFHSIDIGGRAGRTFASERAAGEINVFDALAQHIQSLRNNKKRVLITAWSEGARDRLGQVLADHNVDGVETVVDWPAAAALPENRVALTVLPIETGFETADFAVIGDQDILGDRLVRSARRRKRPADALLEATSLSEGDLIVHVDHGIGRFSGLKTIEAAGAPHDCVELTYAGGDRLFLPVENIDLLTRYGAEGSDATLDRLGGAGWQTRKARLKKRIREIADDLIRTAAARTLRKAPALTPQSGLYDEFSARFPYEETDDQLTAIEATTSDLVSGSPMDRLICGDVGFGKTEVALRAAFIAALEGKQVAIVVPTTLLARQHYQTFSDRFRGLPVNIAQASRLVGSAELAKVKSGLANGNIDIAIGTHALLAKSIEFRDLGLLIIDEEQHFGVKHKERLKELKSDVHVLTLTATPIPRTLQLALTGVRDLSIIATPPADRLAVRTFISPFDTLTIREALLRERIRGGQSFYVVPRISDIGEIKEFLDREIPEARVAVAHGQMPPGELDQVMTAFYDGNYDILLSTTIVESGLDVPTANTLIVHRSDMFGLAQLYQLRGRIGRSKTRAYALFTVPANRKLTANAERRLKVLQSLDTLGAGFQLASHDLDIRGSGNLLGEEQSGHIREVGFELYQQMLEEAVASLRAGDEETEEDRWSPQITIGMAVLIPEAYVPDLQLRMNLYRRLADLDTPEEIDDFAAELTDRFGQLPDEVDHLIKIVYVKSLCRRANVEKVEAGPKGVVIGLRGNEFQNPAGLLNYIAEQGSMAKIRPDQRIVLIRDWKSGEDRLKGVATIMTRLVRLAEDGDQRAA